VWLVIYFKKVSNLTDRISGYLGFIRINIVALEVVFLLKILTEIFEGKLKKKGGNNEKNINNN
jgi:hypothetical protein